jgi:predicted DNA-binding protein
MTIRTSIDIPKETNEKLKIIAKEDGRSVKNLLERIIKKYVEDFGENKL